MVDDTVREQIKSDQQVIPCRRRSMEADIYEKKDEKNTLYKICYLKEGQNAAQRA